MPRTVSPEALRCSFCGKSQFDIAKLVAGPGVYICNECIDLCNQIITEEMARKGGSADDAARSDKPQDPPTLKTWEALSDEDLLAEMVRAHAAHQNVDRAVAHHVAALQGARRQLGAYRRSPRYDASIGLGALFRRGVAVVARLGMHEGCPIATRLGPMVPAGDAQRDPLDFLARCRGQWDRFSLCVLSMIPASLVRRAGEGSRVARNFTLTRHRDD